MAAFSFYFLIGLIVGSFLNVCIHRIPRGQSLHRPRRSYCPVCDHTIRFYDNIPVLSFFFLQGRCRDCGSPISFRYPAVELLNGLAYLACMFVWGWTSPTLVNSLLLSLIITLAFIDFDHQILPNRLTLPGMLAGFLLSPFQDKPFFNDTLTLALAGNLPLDGPSWTVPLVGSFLGAMVGSLLLLLVYYIYLLVRRKHGLGMGDVKMIAMVGAFLGWRMSLLTIFAGSFLGSLFGVYLMLRHGRSLQHKLAFGTFLGVGAALSLFAGLPFLRWYLGFL